MLAKSRALKDGKTIPNLVFKIEAFERDIIKLTKRCGIDLFGDKYPKISTSRDFRVREIINNDNEKSNSSNQDAEQAANESEDSSNTDDVSISYISDFSLNTVRFDSCFKIFLESAAFRHN